MNFISYSLIILLVCIAWTVNTLDLIVQVMSVPGVIEFNFFIFHGRYAAGAFLATPLIVVICAFLLRREARISLEKLEAVKSDLNQSAKKIEALESKNLSLGEELKKALLQAQTDRDELDRSHDFMLGREERISQLKNEVLILQEKLKLYEPADE